MTKPLQLSVTIATKNKGENPLNCLTSVPFTDKIVVAQILKSWCAGEQMETL